MPEKSAQDKPESKEIKAGFSPGSWATSALAILAFIGILMTAAGYGVALAVETKFGVPHASIFNSSFDLLALSVWFMVWLFNNSSKLLGELFFHSSYWKTAGIAFLWSLGTATVLGCGIFFYEKWLKDWLSRRSVNLKVLGKTKRYFLLSAFVSVSTGIGILISAPLLLICILFGAVVISVVPAMSHTAGEAHIEEYVIRPKRCFSVMSREQRMKQPDKGEGKTNSTDVAVMCVKLMEDGEAVAQGRVVFSTTGAIVLFDPTTGKVAREVLEGRRVETVDILP